MAAFAPAFNAVQDPDDGLSVLFTDTSPWGVGNNDEDYTDSQFTRTLILTDYLANAIITLTLPTGIYTAKWPVPAGTNPWVNVDFNSINIATPSTFYDLIQKYPFMRQFELAYNTEVETSCGCCPGKHPDMCLVDALLSNAEFAIPVGDAPNYQNFINGAYKALTA